jgi:hypothetical protein
MSRSKYKKRFWVTLALSGAIVLCIVGGAVAYLVRYSATSEKVCGQCHPELIEPWKNSTGHPAGSTTCYECHSKGIKFLPDRWNILAHARDQFVPPGYLADDGLTSQRCMDCHADVLDLGYIVKKKVIKFNHRLHFQDGLECIGCHRTAGHEYLMEGTNRPSIPECLDCHYREMDGPPKDRECRNCHEVMLAPGRMWTLISSKSLTKNAKGPDVSRKRIDSR